VSASGGETALRAQGYRFVTVVEPVADDYDAQGHLNNASTVRLFNDLRIAYVRGEIGPNWLDELQRDQLVVGRA